MLRFFKNCFSSSDNYFAKKLEKDLHSHEHIHELSNVIVNKLIEKHQLDSKKEEDAAQITAYYEQAKKEVGRTYAISDYSILYAGVARARQMFLGSMGMACCYSIASFLTGGTWLSIIWPPVAVVGGWGLAYCTIDTMYDGRMLGGMNAGRVTFEQAAGLPLDPDNNFTVEQLRTAPVRSQSTTCMRRMFSEHSPAPIDESKPERIIYVTYDDEATRLNFWNERQDGESKLTEVERMKIENMAALAAIPGLPRPFL